MKTKYLCACLKIYHTNLSLKQGYSIYYVMVIAKMLTLDGLPDSGNSMGVMYMLSTFASSDNSITAISLGKPTSPEYMKSGCWNIGVMLE